MIRNEIFEHEKDHDPDLPPRDFIDMYLNEIKVIFSLQTMLIQGSPSLPKLIV